MKIHIENTATCAICLKVLKNKKCLPSHTRAMHQNTESSIEWECSQCYKIFKHEKYLRNHIRGTHTKNAFNCEKCSETFNSKYFLKKHIIKHENNTQNN